MYYQFIRWVENWNKEAWKLKRKKNQILRKLTTSCHLVLTFIQKFYFFLYQVSRCIYPSWCSYNWNICLLTPFYNLHSSISWNQKCYKWSDQKDCITHLQLECKASMFFLLCLQRKLSWFTAVYLCIYAIQDHLV